MRLSRLLVWGMAATVGGTALLFIVFTYVPPMRGWVQEPAKIIACGLFTIVYLAVAMVCTVCAEHGRAPRLMRSGLIGGLVGLLAMYVAIVPDSEVLMRIALPPAMWGMLMAVIGLLLLPQRRPGWWSWARAATIALVSLLAAVICIGVSFRPPGWSEAWVDSALRTGWSVAFLAAGAATATMLGVWIPGLAAPPVVSTTPRPYRLRCPRCGTGQEAVTGEHHCRSCGLKIRVEVA